MKKYLSFSIIAATFTALSTPSFALNCPSAEGMSIRKVGSAEKFMLDNVESSHNIYWERISFQFPGGVLKLENISQTTTVPDKNLTCQYNVLNSDGKNYPASLQLQQIYFIYPDTSDVQNALNNLKPESIRSGDWTWTIDYPEDYGITPVEKVVSLGYTPITPNGEGGATVAQRYSLFPNKTKDANQKITLHTSLTPEDIRKIE